MVLLRFSLIFAAVVACLLLRSSAAEETAVLPSWNDGKVKQSLLQFVRDVTDAKGPRFVPPKDRIAVFDNDGTLWVERPMYAQVLFTLDAVREVGEDPAGVQEAANPQVGARWRRVRPGQAEFPRGGETRRRQPGRPDARGA